MPGASAVSRFLRERPFAADAVLAAAVTALALSTLAVGTDYLAVEGRPPDALEVLLVLAANVPLAWRRAAPTAVLWAVTPPSVLINLLGYLTGLTGVSVLVAVYTVAAWQPRRLQVAALIVGLTAMTVAIVGGRVPFAAVDLVASSAVLIGVWLLGRTVGLRRAYTRELEARAERLEQARDADLRAVVAEERNRIARELHDVVGHHVSVMTVQAAAARRTLRRDPDRSHEAMLAVESTGRAALAELRRLLGVLREDRERATAAGAVEAPQPGLADLEELIRSFRSAGLPVRYAVAGDAGPLPTGIDLAVYRIVQEALTNTLRHGGPGATAEVRIGLAPSQVTVRVRDDGRGVAAQWGDAAASSGRPGHGLLGIRERAAVYGGRAVSGPRSGGGFEVLAVLPVDAGYLHPPRHPPPTGAAAPAPLPAEAPPEPAADGPAEPPPPGAPQPARGGRT